MGVTPQHRASLGRRAPAPPPAQPKLSEDFQWTGGGEPLPPPTGVISSRWPIRNLSFTVPASNLTEVRRGTGTMASKAPNVTAYLTNCVSANGQARHKVGMTGLLPPVLSYWMDNTIIERA
ncbi:hypothetical protein BLNAU_18249 [Blattamonas nauphoetae]|uniref:Uncharacterized protein n=1 Tax=Blattamonas nauphoetae TaxID=2049346 RepID=A0ABQ9X4U0_9EUKA|nr:hypothetical protein BLNAU_18249 [Blattamonas nauphoetae]